MHKEILSHLRSTLTNLNQLTTMKTIHLALATLASSCILNAAELRPMPAYYPSAPDKDKAIADYTPSDVLGCIGTIQLPEGHKFLEGKQYEAGLKANWAGAKDATKIDAMLQLVLDAPSTIEWGELNGGFTNVCYAMREVMDVTAVVKADALVRVVVAQTDPLKTVRAKTFAAGLFEEFLDPRLLAYEKERLDDATVVGDMVREGDSGNIHDIVTARRDSRDIILLYLERTLGMTVDETPFRIEDEAAGCAALKAWLTAHWTEISTKCAEKAAVPNRQLPTVFSAQWDARP